MLKSLIASIAVVLAAATPAFATIEWQFTTADNPASPEIGGPGPTADITLGEFASGWYNDAGYGTLTGYWDLGSSGSVTLNIPNLTSLSGSHNVMLSIVQFVFWPIRCAVRWMSSHLPASDLCSQILPRTSG